MADRENDKGLDIGVPNTGGEWVEPEAEDAAEFLDANLQLDVLNAFGKNSQGRRPSKPPLAFEVTRPLEIDDAMAMQNAPARKQGEAGGMANLQRLRTIHHQIARMLSSGTKIIDIARILGVTPVRIQQLKKDPAFVELQKHYAELEEVAELSLKHRFYLLGTAGMEELQERLMEAPDSFGNGHLMELVKLTVGGEAPQGDKSKTGGRALTEDEANRLKQLSDQRSKSTVTYRQPTETSEDAKASNN